MTILVSIDDTDNLDSRGTGRLARAIADTLAADYSIYGVTRHQLYVHPDIPYTSHNSCAVIHIEENGKSAEPERIFSIAQQIMLADFVKGSDPGIAVASADQVTPPLIAFGKDAKCSIQTQEKARPEPVRVEKKVGRNDPCPCGSGKKYKQCHGAMGE